MTAAPPDADAARASLAWLIAMGADEIVGETPVNRLKEPPPAQEPTAPPTPRVEPPAERLRPRPAPEDPVDAPALAAACGCLEDIIAALATPGLCPLQKTATQLCFADGLPAAHTLIVGEAPGREEDMEGKPFVGRSGQLLDRMLAEIGLSRRSTDSATAVFITNAVYWRPPGNRTPHESELLQCLPFLKRTIALLRPRRILTLGNTPTQRLLARKDGIMSLRGAWRDYPLEGGTIPLLPSLHPSFLLRTPVMKRLAWRDMIALRIARDAD